MTQDGWFKATFEQNISLPVRQSTYDHLVPSVHVKAVRIEAHGKTRFAHQRYSNSRYFGF